MITSIVLSLFLAATSVCLFYSVKKNLFLLEKLEQIDDTLDSVVELLETQHEKILSKTKIEVFSDEPLVRDLVQDISIACDAVKKSSEMLKDVVDSTLEEMSEQEVE